MVQNIFFKISSKISKNQLTYNGKLRYTKYKSERMEESICFVVRISHEKMPLNVYLECKSFCKKLQVSAKGFWVQKGRKKTVKHMVLRLKNKLRKIMVFCEKAKTISPVQNARPVNDRVASLYYCGTFT